jgi:hypothetical protein
MTSPLPQDTNSTDLIEWLDCTLAAMERQTELEVKLLRMKNEEYEAQKREKLRVHQELADLFNSTNIWKRRPLLSKKTFRRVCELACDIMLFMCILFHIVCTPALRRDIANYLEV